MDKNIPDEVKRMIYVRKALGLTQAQLAEAIGYSLSYVKKIECGDRDLSAEYLRAYCRGLHVPADHVLFNEPVLFLCI